MEKEKPKIILVDDEQDTLDFLSYHLDRNGFEVRSATDGFKALTESRNFEPDIFLIDYMMPEMTGLEFLNYYKKANPDSKALFVFLTAKIDDNTQIETLDQGASDFIMKPVKPNVIVSRLNALLRSHNSFNRRQTDVLTFGDLIINPEYYTVHLDGNLLNLARKEFEILLLLASKPGKVFKREEILDQNWGEDIIISERNIDVHIYRIREKLNNRFIKTVKGIGYKFEE
ncbi:MAG: response regulator transcription factor [Saprospiraceae bacterium]|nr:response regulator transcription factor [Saprospiraceae bacterium]